MPSVLATTLCLAAGGARAGHALAQAFFAPLLEKRVYARADPSRGRFRSFLLTALKHFLVDTHARAQTGKRGGRYEFLPLNEEVHQTASVPAVVMPPYDHEQPLARTTDADPPPGTKRSRCGRSLSTVAASGLGCLTCLLSDGLEDGETGEGSTPVFLAAGERCGDFEVMRDADGSPHELGHGAMGTTYLARDTVLDRPVALKVIGATLATRPGAHARFLREARGAAALRHPHVASIFRYGVREADGQPHQRELRHGPEQPQRPGDPGQPAPGDQL